MFIFPGSRGTRRPRGSTCLSRRHRLEYHPHTEVSTAFFVFSHFQNNTIIQNILLRSAPPRPAIFCRIRAPSLVVWQRILAPAGRAFSAPQVLLLFKEGPAQHGILLLGAHLPAFWRKGFRYRKALSHLCAGIHLTLRTIRDAPFLAACRHLIPAPVLRSASGAGDFLNRYHAIPVSDFPPQLCRMAELFPCLFKRMAHISWACGTVVAAGCDDLSHRFSSLPPRQAP